MSSSDVACHSRRLQSVVWDVATGKEITVLRGHDSPDGSRIFAASIDKTARIWDVHFATMSTKDLIAQTCKRFLLGLTKLTRHEMRLAGYSDDTPAIDVCAGIDQAALP